MSYRDDQDALLARNTALERRVVELAQQPAAAKQVLVVSRAESIARGAASVVGVTAGIWSAVTLAEYYGNFWVAWGGFAVAVVSVVAPFIGRAGKLRPFTIRTELKVACADGDSRVALIAMLHESPEPPDRARRDARFGSRSAPIKQAARDLLEGIVRQELGAIAVASLRSDAAAVSARVQDRASAGLAECGLRVDQLFVASAAG